ncbi:DNA-binding MarR family transcriptional regulator [Breoghania corrubedonensis]|uniref:DNA-binding MarR family transcriptional regulator n=1 Tax=Breoghania corrubedonensis TaxID=665038 RepID=A0A2T5VC87_9HYPH|nr:MarR family transcriptional regulator [Breoghania corrubedonensis]PTW61365.1 DNA-binding MarR family transcriptional regulator [Breoghania corrubedonensis]
MSASSHKPGAHRDPHKLLHLIGGVNRRFEQQIEERLKPARTSIEQYRILDALGARSGRTMSELAGLVFVDSPTLTKIVDRMVAKAEVYRAPDPHDRRKVLVFISEKGAETLRELKLLVAEPEAALAARLPAGDTDRLCSLLENLLAED